MGAADAVEIPLTQGLTTLVDAGDAEAVIAAGPWYVQRNRRNVYAQNSRTGELLHKFLTGWAMTDHVDGNGLDNRRQNLRPATHAENMRNRRKQKNNTTGFKGVERARHDRWRARIQVDGRRVQIGHFATPELAAAAYDKAALDLHGEFARLNSPTSPQGD